MGCGWEVLRGSYGVDFFGVMGFAHQQANFVNSIRLRKKKTISCYLGSIPMCFLDTSQVETMTLQQIMLVSS